MPLVNPLDALFKDIRRELWIEQERKKALPPPPKQSTYANPLNWKAGRTIMLVHETEGPLGLFIEYFHRSSPTARRLLPAPLVSELLGNEAIPPVDCERVRGDWWLHPRNQAPAIPEESEEEIRRIIDRFNELLDQFLEPI